MNQQQQHQHQQQQQHHQVNTFRGLYIGSDLVGYIDSIDPGEEYWKYFQDYINSFPFSKHFFQTCFPFSYMSSRINILELISRYENEFCSFVELFQLNHPDWAEYSETECLQHFKDCLSVFIEDPDLNYTYENNIATPNTLEKPHYEVYNITEDGEGEGVYYMGAGYFENVDNESVIWHRRVGQFGPHGYPIFDLETYLQQQDNDDDGLQYEFHLYRNMKTNENSRFYFGDDDGHTRFVFNSENPENPQVFLFEESFQKEKREKHLEKLRKDEEIKKKLKDQAEELRLLHQRMNALSRESWIRNSSQAFMHDTPAAIEIQVRFASASILPFQHLNLPIMPAHFSDYREPINDCDYESDSDCD